MERKRGEQRADDDESGCEKHASLAGELVRRIAEYQDTDDGTDKQGIGNPGLDCRSVDFGAQEMIKYYICTGCLSLLDEQFNMMILGSRENLLSPVDIHLNSSPSPMLISIIIDYCFVDAPLTDPIIVHIDPALVSTDSASDSTSLNSSAALF